MKFFLLFFISSIAFATGTRTVTTNAAPASPVLTFLNPGNGAPQMAVTPNGVSITQGGVTTLYNRWVIIGASGSKSSLNSAVPLTITFQLVSAAGAVAPLAPITYTIPNILTDGNLNSGISLFFKELTNEAFQMGAIK